MRYQKLRVLRAAVACPSRTQYRDNALICLVTCSSFLKRGNGPNIPIQAIGLSLYESLPANTNGTANAETQIEQPGTKVTRTQWLDLSSLEMANLIGKNVLIVDEVDDTRTTLEYAVRELMKDVEEARKLSGRGGDEAKTTFSIFVLHVRASLGKSEVER